MYTDATSATHSKWTDALSILAVLCALILVPLVYMQPVAKKHTSYQPQHHGAQVITSIDLDAWSRDLTNRLNHAGEYGEQIAILANSTCATGMALTAEDANVRNAATLEQYDLQDFVRQAELQWTDQPVVFDYQAATNALCGFIPDAPNGGA